MNTLPEPDAAEAPSRRPIPLRRILEDPLCFLAFGFGAGLAPVAPGTFGTLAAIPVYALLAGLPAAVYAGIVAALFAAGIPICRHAEDRLRARDHPGIVWDEIVGYLIAMIGVPASWKAAALGFVLFRVFDVLKPWPIGRLDRRLHGGFGIMLDDVLAGGFAAVSLDLMRRFAVI